jgi:hypothetical protein
MYTSAGFVKSGDKMITKKQDTINKINSSISGFSEFGFTSDDFTADEYNAIYKYKDKIEDLIKNGEIKNKQDLLDAIAEFNVGVTGQASEYLSSFTSQMKELGIKTSDTNEILEAWKKNVGGIQDTFAGQMMSKVANSLGIQVEELIKNISVLGDIDVFGRTSKSLPKVTEQFKLIDTVISDIRDNGLVTAENLDALLKEFPELIRYVGQEFNGETLLDVLEDAGKFKASKYMASLENTLATSNLMFEDWADEFVEDERVKKNTLMFGNLDNMQNVMAQIYETDENGEIKKDANGNVIIKESAKNMELTTTDYTKDSWAKLIAENVFGMTTVGDGKTAE